MGAIAVTNSIFGDEHGEEFAIDKQHTVRIGRTSVHTLNATPVDLTPTPAADTAYILIAAAIHKRTGAYNDQDLRIVYGGTDGVTTGVLDANGSLSSASVQRRVVLPFKPSSGDTSLDISFGQPLQLNAAAALTGDDAGYLTINTYYRQVKRP